MHSRRLSAPVRTGTDLTDDRGLMGAEAVHVDTPGVTFTLRGIRNGSLVAVTWVNGVLDGDPPTVDLVEVEADLAVAGRADPLVERLHGAGHRSGTAADLLGDPDAALELVRQVVDRVTEVVGPHARPAGDA